MTTELEDTCASLGELLGGGAGRGGGLRSCLSRMPGLIPKCRDCATSARFGLALEALEVSANFRGVLVAKVRILLESLVNDVFQLRGKIGIQAQRRNGRALEDGVEDEG